MPILGNFPSGGGGGTGGLTLAAVTDIQTLAAAGKVYVKWTDPDDLVVAGSTLAAWGGTLLVRKAGSAPVSRRDGTVVLDSKTRNAYQNEYFCDSGLTDGVAYYYKFFPYTTQGSYTDSADDEFSKTPAPVAVGDVSSMSAIAAGNGKLALKWTDPSATVVNDGVTLATWAKTTVVVKAGGYATDPDDADAAYRLAVTTRNQYASSPLTVTGLENGVTYYVSFFPVSTDGAVNTNTANRITGIPDRLKISTVPSQSGTLTYNGNSQSPIWSDYDANKMTIGNQTAGVNAGSYTAQFTPKDDYCWSDGSTTAKNVTWTIGKKAGTLTVSPTSISLDKDNPSATFTIGGEHDGTVSVSITSGSDIMTISKSGNVVTVTNKNQATGSGAIKVSCAAGTNYTAPSDVSVPVTAKFVTIYGVQWDGTSTTALTRTDAAAGFTNPVPAVSNGTGSSPFDNLLPWSGMTRITDSVAGELVAIPKFWYKFTKSGNTLKLQIADGQVDGFFVSPAHADRGDGNGERDIVYVGRYHCASGYKSTTGVAQQTNITRSTARTNIHNLGTTIWQFDYAMRLTIQILYLVEFADWNSQTKIGYGCSASGSKVNNGQTDAMQYHTGTTAANRTTYGFTQYRYIEGLWDNVYDWMDGCYYNSSGMNIILNPNNFSDSANGTSIGTPPRGWISAFNVVESGGVQWLCPSGNSGSDSTYIPDIWDFYASGPCLYCGGSYGRDLGRGLFCVYCYGTSGSVANIGCRLQKLP